MPQPLRSVIGSSLRNREADVDFAATAIHQRPVLLALLMQILFLWSRVEQTLAVSFANTLGTQPEIGVEIYIGLEHNHAQLRVLRDAAAMVVLDKADMALYDAILTVVRAAGRKRNLVAHGIWGICRQVPDGLVLLQHKDFSRVHYPFFARWGYAVPETLTPEHVAEHAEYIEKINTQTFEVLDKSSVYFEREFREMHDLVATANNSIHSFWRMWRKHAGPEREELRRHLCDVPAIREALSRPSKDQTTFPEES
jgi:hypothetical protein